MDRGLGHHTAEVTLSNIFLFPLPAGSLEVLQCLLEAGANSQQAPKVGVTPLHHAAQCGHVPIIERLLAAGADPKKTDSDGFTSLLAAARTGQLDALQRLVEEQCGGEGKAGDILETLLPAVSRGPGAVEQYLVDVCLRDSKRARKKGVAASEAHREAALG